jgi:hypothetical protein
MSILEKYEIISGNRFRLARYSYGAGDINILPYDSERVFEVAARYGIKIPKKIIDMSMGTSKCSVCDTVYQGLQPECYAKVTKWKTGYHWEYMSPLKSRLYKEHKEEGCGGRVQGWTLNDEFYDQKSLFELISMLSDLDYGTTNAHFDKHLASFPEGVATALKFRLVTSRLDNLEHKNAQMIQAIQEIAQKMNAAGNALSFNF